MRATRSADMPLSTGIDTTVVCNVVATTVGLLPPLLNTSTGIVTIQETGEYALTAFGYYSDNATGRRIVAIRTTSLGQLARHTPGNTGGNNPGATCAATVRLLAGDTVYMTAYQDSGVTLQFSAAALTVAKVGPGPQGPQGPQGKQTISRAVDFGTLRTLTVGSYAEINTALRIAINCTLGNYVRLSLTGLLEHSAVAPQFIVFQVFDVTGGALLPNSCTYAVWRSAAASAGTTFTWETVLPVASSGASGYVLPGPRTLTMYAQTGVANAYARNDSVPLVFVAQELQQ
jgi:hypothetical protein